MSAADASFARMKADISMARPTISAHRLWTTLWMFLGQPLDNSAWRVGNRQATNSCRRGTHTFALPPGPEATATVGTGTRSGLRKAMFSPASTVPMTTTELYLNQLPSTKQAPRGSQHATRPARWHA
jgi:hypothetical protein